MNTLTLRTASAGDCVVGLDLLFAFWVRVLAPMTIRYMNLNFKRVYVLKQFKLLLLPTTTKNQSDHEEGKEKRERRCVRGRQIDVTVDFSTLSRGYLSTI